MTYLEKLDTVEWKTKRKEILFLHNSTCCRCGANRQNGLLSNEFTFHKETLKVLTFEFLIDTNYNTKFVFIKSLTHIIPTLCRTNLDVINKDDEYSLIINRKISIDFELPFNGSNYSKSGEHLKKLNKFLDPDTKKLMENHFQIKQGVEIDVEALWFVKQNDVSLFTKNLNKLEVHHKCYRKGYEIWNQPNDDYLVLCNVCHRVVHENQNIPYYDIKGRIFQLSKPCVKCSGRGRIKAYNHIKNGICFSCNGSGSDFDIFNILD